MSKKLNILNSREVKRIRQLVVEEFSCFPEGDYAFLMNDKQKLFIVNRTLSEINLNNLIVDRIGLYFAEIKNKQVRLSKEGAQFLYLNAQMNGKELNNIVELNKEEIEIYFKGNDLEKDFGEDNKLIILKYENNILGCAKYKEGKIINFLPKIYRGTVIV